VKVVEGILREQNRYAATLYNIGERTPISGIRAAVETFKQSGASIIVSVGGAARPSTPQRPSSTFHMNSSAETLFDRLPYLQHSVLQSILYGVFLNVI